MYLLDYECRPVTDVPGLNYDERIEGKQHCESQCCDVGEGMCLLRRLETVDMLAFDLAERRLCDDTFGSAKTKCVINEKIIKSILTTRYVAYGRIVEMHKQRDFGWSLI